MYSHRDEEGGEHLRKRSMHLPFTFATGEAMLYQIGYPLHGFPDSFQGKAKGSKPKKGKLNKSSDSSDDLDPKSLLGAVMSQDESVYVCQPDTEPKMSYHSSLFSEQQGDSSYSGLLSGDSWHVVSNGETGRCDRKTPSYDPLLATLDSLSLDGEETCSNSELFSALENLGLNAEDLELLLLDERMIQVELDPNHIPTLNDLLTNNEILSYIHDSLEIGTEAEEQGDRGGIRDLSPPNPDSAQSVTQQPQVCLTPAVPPALPSSRQPITQLSQQMQRHISAGELVKAQPVTQSGALDTKILAGIPDGHWVVASENHHHPNNHAHHHPHTVLKTSQLNSQHKHLNSPLELSQQWQPQQDHFSVHLQSHQQASSQSSLAGFQNQLGLTNGSYIPNGHAAFPRKVAVSHMGYSISSTPRPGSTVLNGMTTPGACHHQTSVATTQPYQLQGHQKHQQQQMLQQTQVPPSCLPQCPTQSHSLEFGQLLGLSQPPSLEAYSLFNTTQDSTHSKVRHQGNGVT